MGSESLWEYVCWREAGSLPALCWESLRAEGSGAKGREVDRERVHVTDRSECIRRGQKERRGSL